jgi:hypothetical protein
MQSPVDRRMAPDSLFFRSRNGRATTGNGDATMANRYRCYLLDIDRIVAVCVIECDNDAAALQEVGRILEASPCTTAEIWDCTRKVSIISKKNIAA